MNLHQYIIGYTWFTSPAVRACQTNQAYKMFTRPLGMNAVWPEEES